MIEIFFFYRVTAETKPKKKQNLRFNAFAFLIIQEKIL